MKKLITQAIFAFWCGMLPAAFYLGCAEPAKVSMPHRNMHFAAPSDMIPRMLEGDRVGVGSLSFALTTDGASDVVKSVEETASFTNITDDEWTLIALKCPHLVGTTSSGAKYIYGWPEADGGATGFSYFRISNEHDKSFVAWIRASMDLDIGADKVPLTEGPLEVYTVMVTVKHEVPAHEALWPSIKTQLKEVCL